MAKRAGLARISGTLRPNFTSSCSQLFEKRGDAWLSPREKDREFPLRQSRPADIPLSSEQLKADAARKKMRHDIRKAQIKETREKLFKTVEEQSLGVIPSGQAQSLIARLMDRLIELHEADAKDGQDFRPPQPHLHIDPDLDAYTKAERAKPREKFVDVPGKAIENDPQRRATAAILSMRKKIKGCKPIESSSKRGSPKKVKGSFYRFADVTEKIAECEQHPPRAFPQTPVKSVRCRNCSRTFDANRNRNCPNCHRGVR